MKRVLFLVLFLVSPAIAALGPYTATDLGFRGSGMKIYADDTVWGNYDPGIFSWKEGVLTHREDYSVVDPFWWGKTSNSSGHSISNVVFPGHGAFWNGTSYIDLGIGAAYEINELSQVVGYGSFPEGHQPARILGYLWEPGQGFTYFGTLGGAESIAFGINESGMVAGQSYISGNIAHRPFVWYRGQMMELPTPDGIPGTPSWAYSINESGHITGKWRSTDTGNYQPVLWIPEPATLGLLLIGGLALLSRRRSA